MGLALRNSVQKTVKMNFNKHAYLELRTLLKTTQDRAFVKESHPSPPLLPQKIVINIYDTF